MRGRSRQSRHTAHLMSSGSSGADASAALVLVALVVAALLAVAVFVEVLPAARDGEDSGDNRVGMMIVTFYLVEWFLMGTLKKRVCDPILLRKQRYNEWVASTASSSFNIYGTRNFSCCVEGSITNIVCYRK